MKNVFYHEYPVWHMKNVIRKKLKSNEGASLMVALLFFVVCAAIGSIVLTAATAASGRMKGIKNNNQNFYSVLSAAKIYETDWTQGAVTMYRNAEGKIKIIDSTGEIDVTSSWYAPNFISCRDMLASEVFKDGYEHTYEFEVKLDGASDGDGYNPTTVKAFATMHNNYDIEIVFTSMDKDGNDSSGSSITLLLTHSDIPIDGKTKIGWANPKLSFGGFDK
ncbi:MAG: hypothetical protein K6A70_10745 [Erysipelotrichaceae bacterium]|nr:hypothetical protein [Erysipelotrichaceae bacterium]